MALHKRAEFAVLCGITTSNITQYIKRSKLITSGDYIDDSIDPNKSFLQKRLEILKDKIHQDEPPADQEKKSTAKPAREFQYKAPEPRPQIIPNVAPPDSHIKKTTIFDLEVDQKTLNIEQTKENIELIKLKKEKAMGLVIPTPQIKVLVAQHSKSITVSFYNAADVILTRLAKKCTISVEDQAALRGELRQSINEAVESAVNTTKKHLKNIVDEYSERRGVGEKA
jgi:hypothetical protein